jgi:hypothetical protein
MTHLQQRLVPRLVVPLLPPASDKRLHIDIDVHGLLRECIFELIVVVSVVEPDAGA